MAVPDYQSLMLHALVLSAAGEIRVGDAVERLAGQLNLTPDERTQLLPSGKQTLFGNRVHWAKTYLTKAGSVEGTRRGHSGFRSAAGRGSPRTRRGWPRIATKQVTSVIGTVPPAMTQNQPTVTVQVHRANAEVETVWHHPTYAIT